MNNLYPIRFKPIPRQMIWGGNRLRNKFNKDFRNDLKIGESWEISAYPGYISVVENGHLKGNTIEELVEVYMGDLVGEKIFQRFGLEFPLLIKFIDASEVLSVQVHPDDETASLRNNASGKTEMWYVLEAEPDAELISGFRQEVSPGLFMEKLKSGKLLDLLNVEKVNRGDVFFMPAGRVHAIGKGIILAEIQQTSDSTYRIYDWDRKDPRGKSRELHIEEAMEVIDFNFYDNYKTVVEPRRNNPVLLAECQYFTTSLLELEGTIERDYTLVDSFVIYICTFGEFSLKWRDGATRVKKGDTLLLPASIGEFILSGKPDARILEVYIK